MRPASEAADGRAVEFQPFDVAALPGAALARPALPFGLDDRRVDLGLGALLRFRALMAAAGHEVALARLCYDRLYAYERIAAAHATADEDLRRLALELFQIYHRRGAAGLAAQ